MPGVEHRQHKGLNNRAENSHQPTRRRERQMKRFKSARQGTAFTSRLRHRCRTPRCQKLGVPNLGGDLRRYRRSAVWTSPDAQHPLIFDILSGRGGLNHGWVTKDVGWRSLAERFGLNLLTQECYRVLAGGTPSSIAPLG